MPIHLIPDVSRRRFLQSTSMAGAAAVLAAKGLTAGDAEAAQSANRWAWVSDTHIPEDPHNGHRGFEPQANLISAIGQIQKARPEGAIITGDVARLEGFTADYAAVKKLLGPLQATTPVHMCLGNHDDRKNFLRQFPNLPGDSPAINGKYVSIIETGGVRFVLLDSLLYVNRVAGLLGRAQRGWLSEFLARPDQKPTVLFLHHTLGDGDGALLDTDRMMATVRPAKSVKAIVFGHSHVYQYGTDEGIHLINLPATGYNFNDKDPIGWVETLVTPEGADLTLHTIGGNQENDGKTTSLAWRT